MKKSFKLISSIINFLLFTLLVSCSIFDSNDTSSLIKYPSPNLSNLKIKEDQISIDISINLNPTINYDFSNYIILLGKDTEDITKSYNLENLTHIENIQFYISHTTKPNFRGNGVDTITHNFTATNLTSGNNYHIAALSFGYNKSYGQFYDNNGWIYSSISSSISFHKSLSTNSLIAHNFYSGIDSPGYITENNQIVLTNYPGIDPLSLDYEVVFFINASIEGNYNYYIGTGLGSGAKINSIYPYNNIYEIINTPVNGYLPAGYYLPIFQGSCFILKRTNNTYQKIQIEIVPIPTAKNENSYITFNVVYSDQENISRF